MLDEGILLTQPSALPGQISHKQIDRKDIGP